MKDFRLVIVVVICVDILKLVIRKMRNIWKENWDKIKLFKVRWEEIFNNYFY